MILYLSLTFVPPPGVDAPAEPTLVKETHPDNLGRALRDLLTIPTVGELLAMGSSVVLVISKHKTTTSAVLERMQ